MPSQSVSSKSNMKQILKEAGNTTVIAEFYADWCGNCTKIMPAYERMSQEYDDAIFLKVDVDKHDDIHPDYNVSATPTFLVFQKGKVVEKFAGSNVGKLEDVIKKYA